MIQQVDTERLPDGSSVPVSVSSVYDALGRVVERVESDGRRWQTQYDARGNVTKEIDPERNATSYEYNDRGLLGSMRVPGNETKIIQFLVARTDEDSPHSSNRPLMPSGTGGDLQADVGGAGFRRAHTTA